MMSHGQITPGIYDGMGAFRGRSDTTILIRNHENREQAGRDPGRRAKRQVVRPSGHRGRKHEGCRIDEADHEDDTDQRRDRVPGFAPVRFQARDKGAAVFDREEGIWGDGERLYFDCTAGWGAQPRPGLGVRP
jgi:secreted PhoX family phosphatase